MVRSAYQFKVIFKLKHPPGSFIQIVNGQNLEAGGRDHDLGLVNLSSLKQI